MKVFSWKLTSKQNRHDVGHQRITDQWKNRAIEVWGNRETWIDVKECEGKDWYQILIYD